MTVRVAVASARNAFPWPDDGTPDVALCPCPLEEESSIDEFVLFGSFILNLSNLSGVILKVPVISMHLLRLE